MSRSHFNFSPGSPYHPSQDGHRNRYQFPTAGAIQHGSQGSQRGNWHDLPTSDSSSALLSSTFTLPLLGNNPPFHFGDNTTYSSKDGSMVGIQRHGSNNQPYFAGGPSTSQEIASSSQLTQPILNAEGYQRNNSGSAYSFGGSYTDGSNTAGANIIGGQACGSSDTTYHFGGYGNRRSHAETYSSMSQVTFASSAAGLQGFRGDISTQNMPVYETYGFDGAVGQSQLIAKASTATLQLSQSNSTLPHIRASRGSMGFEQGHDNVPI
ncbi:hypothetical protein H1R20_g300, partial [Candolleomyces eurysporus]